MRHTYRKAQSGVVLIIALIVLVAMTLAALALIRSVDTNNLIAGNMAFQQAAVHSADTGIELAAAWIDGASDATLEDVDNSHGYVPNGSISTYSPGSTDHYSWDEYWNNYVKDNRALASTTQVDQAGNTVSYIIDRLCSITGTKNNIDCVLSPTSVVGTGNSAGVGNRGQFNAPVSVYYRITVRVDGPRNTVSYVQSVVSK